MFPRMLIFVLWLLVCSHAGRARAEPEPARETSSSEAPSRWTLGVRGFGGVLFSEGDVHAGGGGGVLLAFAVLPERWEVELGLSVLATRASPLGVFEAIGKRSFERRGNWAPHLLLGPVFSLDFGEELKPSGGLLIGGGVTHWLTARVGVVADGAYRLLIGSEIEDVLTLAAGLSFRL